MKKAVIEVRTSDGIVKVNGYVNGGVGIHRDIRNNKEWVVTDLNSGLGCFNKHFKTRKEAETNIEGAIANIEGIKAKNPDRYGELVEGFNKLTGKKVNTKANTESEGKKMAKTNTTKAKAVKPETKAQLKELNEALKREIEILKKQIESFESAVKVESITIDTFDVEGYMASRDDSNRITPELVEAFENTKGLTVIRKGKDEWLYIKGETEADTKERKDIFKAMGFRWSANENAWFIAPYPLRSKKAWGAKKARKAMANA